MDSTYKILRLPNSTSGSSTNHPSHSCGEVDVLSDQSSWRISLLRIARTQNWKIFYSTTSSTRLSTKLNQDGEISCPREQHGVFQLQPSVPPWASTTVFDRKIYQQTYFKPKEITLARIPSISSHNMPTKSTRKAPTFISTGQVEEEMFLLQPTKHKLRILPW